MPGEDMIKDVRSKLYMSILLLTNLANLFEDKELCKARSEADNDGKTARGGSRRGAKGQQMCNYVSTGFTKRNSPTLRIGIVNVYCELVSVKLHGKNLEPRDRKLRNQLAAVMLVPTVNIFRLLVNVRTVYRSISTTVMQVYAVEFFNCNVERLLIEKCMQLSTFRRLVRLVSGRVKDKSVLFRKCALLLLTALVENNPFSVELSIESVSRQTDNVKADLERLRLLSESIDCTFVVHPVLAVVSVLPADGISKREETEVWNRPVGNFQEAVTEMIAVNKKYANNCNFSLMLNSDLSLDEFKAQVMRLLRKVYMGLRTAGSVIYLSISKEQVSNAIDYPAGVDLLRKQLVCAFLEALRIRGDWVRDLPRIIKSAVQSHMADSHLVDRSFGRLAVWPTGRLADWSFDRQRTIMEIFECVGTLNGSNSGANEKTDENGNENRIVIAFPPACVIYAAFGYSRPVE
ncbi:hypothetical protein M513_10921 [Trichuris suis]|uniref:Uncharacterized protein n=1 Tax=Trichuris suis TaxID=68888 RepID=A0A085LTB1_9BILA|nr:hypothetical protein M513_10921 [Trichuris suis]